MRKRIALLCVLCFLFPITGCTIGDTEFVWHIAEEAEKDYIFSINGVECSREEAKLYLCNYQNIYGYEYGLNLWEHDFGPMHYEDKLETYVKEVTISELANVLCMSLLAEQKNLVLTEGEKIKAQNAANEYYNSLNEAELSYIKLTKEQLLEYYERYAVAQKLYETLTEGVNEEVSDDEARVIRVQQIFVSTQAVAGEVAQKLKDGGNFQALASSYNEAESIETIIKRGDYPKAVEEVAFHLDNGEQSEMIVTNQGYYFIRCLNKFEAEMTEENKFTIIANRRKEQFEDVFDRFVAMSVYDFDQIAWEDIELDISGNIKTDSFFEVYEKHFR